MRPFKYNNLQCIANESRGIVLDAIKAANSGHLGMPMGCAEIGAALFGKLLKYDPINPSWINRDRFVLSAGHGSMFLYTWLHLAGYNISLNDIKNFRKTGSTTNGHPEFNKELGIECTSGPLGQGVANAVGMAIAREKHATKFNKPNAAIIDYNVVCLCGDGCLQEGVAIEACSLAGHWKLKNLIIILDANETTLDACLSKSQSENISKKFHAMGFEVFQTDGNNINKFIKTFEKAKKSTKQSPKLIIAKTIIGKHIPNIENTNKAHGTAGLKFIDETKQSLNLPRSEFFISGQTKQFFQNRRQHCHETFLKWKDLYQSIFDEQNHSIDKNEINWDNIPSCNDAISTRVAAGKILQYIAHENDNIISGSADLFSSNNNYILDGGDFSDTNLAGKNIFFGIREHAMAAINNGIAYDGTFIPISATFLVFSDYMRAAIRVAALAKLHAIFWLTHDSIAVGEDGPTHQPIETIASLRCIPNIDVVRPANYEETVGALKLAIKNKNRPTALILSRQNIPHVDIPNEDIRNNVSYGAYIAKHETMPLKAIIISSGSELSIALDVSKEMPNVRVVSMPCMEAFERQSDDYKEKILPKSCTIRISIEAGVSMPWYRYLGTNGTAISVEDFGFSGCPEDLMQHFGITKENLKTVVDQKLAQTIS